MIRTAWPLLLACAYLHPATAWAVDPTRLISQYAHTAWRVQDGFFRGSPYTFVQTEDGYLWIGTDSGVVRFDGMRFVPWDSERDRQLPNSEIVQLLAPRDGGLWIATLGGLSRWKERQLTNYSVGPGGATAMLEDRRGTIWIARRVANAAGQVLCQWAEPEPRCLGPADGVPSLGVVQALIEDRVGNLWIGGDTSLVRWSASSHTAYRPTGLQNNAGIAGITAIAEAPDGTLWVGIFKTGPDLGLQRLVDGRLEPFRTSQLDGSTPSVRA